MNIRKLYLLLLLIAMSFSARASEPKYAPDRQTDILHIKIDITPDMAQHTIVARNCEQLRDPFDVARNVIMAEHYTFRLARRAAGEKDRA